MPQPRRATILLVVFALFVGLVFPAVAQTAAPKVSSALLQDARMYALIKPLQLMKLSVGYNFKIQLES